MAVEPARSDNRARRASAPDLEAQRQVRIVVIFGLVFATIVLGAWFDRGFLMPDPASWEQGRIISAAYDPPDEVVELYFNQGDGQLFAHQAQDPFVRHPEGIRGGPSEEAYRLQRPLYGWIGWLASAGQPGAVAWALIAVTMLSVGLLAGVAAVASAALGRSPLWGFAVLLAPGVAADLLRCGPEVTGTALLGIGLLAWIGRERRPWLAVGCFAAACLARETMVVVPVTLALVDWWGTRMPGSAVTDIRRLFRSRLLLSVVPFLVWVLALRVGLGAWPRGNVEGRLSVIPFAGLIEARGTFGTEEYLATGLILIPAIVAVLRRGDHRLRALVAVHLLVASMLGSPVWAGWLDFGRVLLPLSLVSLLALLSGVQDDRGTAAEEVVPVEASAGSPRPLEQGIDARSASHRAARIRTWPRTSPQPDRHRATWDGGPTSPRRHHP